VSKIVYHPKIGSVVICDFNRTDVPQQELLVDGFEKPEMVKKRPAIVVSYDKMGGRLCTIVPLSQTAPDKPQPWHHQLETVPTELQGIGSWAKCDMITTVAFERLERVRVNSFATSGYVIPRISDADLKAVQRGVLHALRLWNLTPHV
jgi:mRNA interferase MazF